MAKQPDSLYRFVLEGSAVRGEFVHLDGAWGDVLGRHDYPASVRTVLGESVAAVALLAATIKLEGTLTLQASGRGPLRLLAAEATNKRTVRGLARFEGALPAEPDLLSLLGEGHLAITLDAADGRERYQGMVDLSARKLADALADYFERSEQLPTRLWLAADETRAAGLLLQRLPAEEDGGEDADVWERSQILTETITEAELLGLDVRSLLNRLYAEEQVRLFSPERWGFHCPCSKERVQTMLLALGRGEVEAVLAEEGAVTVDCEFCAMRYAFDAVDVAEIFAGDAVLPPSTWTM